MIEDNTRRSRERRDTSEFDIPTFSINTSVDVDEPRPHQSRRQHQEALRKKQKRRQKRARRLRALMGVRFWMRATIVIAILLCMVFWAKFALVYDIPEDIHTPGLTNVAAYVTVKPWWFGPPVFDLGQTVAERQRPYLSAEDALLQGLGRYSGIVLEPEYVWILKR